MWVKGGVVLTSVATGNESDARIMLSTDCPVSIGRVSEPLCVTGHEQSDLSGQTSEREDPPHPWSVPWWVLVVSMATEMVVLVLVFLSVALLVGHLRTRWRHR